MIAAKEVGGDFYDFYKLSDTTVAFLAADVSGKGIPAAMFMMTAKTIIKDLAERGLAVNEIFTQANEKLCENNESGMENPPTSRSKKRKRYIMGKTKTPITIIPTAVAKLAKRMCSDIMPIPDDISVTLPLYTPPSNAAGIKSSTKISMPTPVGTQRLKRGGLFFMMNDEGNINSRDNIPQPICFQPLPSYLRQVCGYPPPKDLQSRCVREYAAESSRSYPPNCRSAPSNTSLP
ncbi:MAG: SpoIIE family protein phosphatase [Spirochaetales bacterium]|nr:SpoIIE family protein phosphatase [Spirochaetales bacterium]